jgi:hypothetical protein
MRKQLPPSAAGDGREQAALWHHGGEQENRATLRLRRRLAETLTAVSIFSSRQIQEA